MIRETIGQLQDSSHRLLATGAATVAMTGLAHQTPAQADMNSNHIPEAAAKAIRRNAARLTELGCSAWLIRGAHDEVDGIITAVHCNLTDSEAPRIVGSDKQQYIVERNPIKAQVGERVGHMKTVAVIDEFVLPGTPEYPDTNHDLALGVAKGHTAQEVIKDYKRDVLPIAKLNPGDTLYEGAYPVAQPANGNHMKRQAFRLTVLNKGLKPVGYDKVAVPMLFASMPATKDGAECSYGASGSVSFAMIRGKSRPVATLSYFDDLTGSLGEYTTAPQPRKTPIAAICGFSYQLDQPRTGNNDWNNFGSIVKTKRTTAEIPGYLTPEQMMDSARRQFENPNIGKTVLNGSLSMPNLKGGPDTPAFNKLIERPILFHFSTPATTLIAEADPTEPDNLRINIFSDLSLGAAQVFSDNPDQNSFLQTSGPIEYRQSDSANPEGSFIDETQQQFGVQTTHDPDYSKPSYRLAYGQDGFSLESSPK